MTFLAVSCTRAPMNRNWGASFSGADRRRNRSLRTMSDRRSWRLDAAAGVLLLLGLLLTVAVVRHDPADLDEGVYPLHATPHNLLGLPGAWVARALVGGLGFAAYVFLATWFVLVLLLFLRRGWLAWGLRLTGWLLLTPCAAVVADRFGGDMARKSTGWAGRLRRCLAVDRAGGAPGPVGAGGIAWRLRAVRPGAGRRRPGAPFTALRLVGTAVAMGRGRIAVLFPASGGRQPPDSASCRPPSEGSGG